MNIVIFNLQIWIFFLFLFNFDHCSSFPVLYGQLLDAFLSLQAARLSFDWLDRRLIHYKGQNNEVLLVYVSH